MLGVPILEIEVSLASNIGFCLLLVQEELFVPFSDFPWFQRATNEAVITIKKPSSNHLYWPLLDINLSFESIRNPVLCRYSPKPNPSFKRYYLKSSS